MNILYKTKDNFNKAKKKMQIEDGQQKQEQFKGYQYSRIGFVVRSKIS